jgi:hypothetical protein
MSKATERARALLVSQDITAFRLTLEKLKFAPELIILFDTFEGYARETNSAPITREQIPEGCTVTKGGKYVILTHDANPPSMKLKLHRSNSAVVSRQTRSAKLRNRWTIAHEIGHIYMKHSKDGVREEREADLFAAELLMPELVLLELRKQLGRELYVSEVARLFGASKSAAANRLELITRKEFFSAYLRTEIMQKYRELIENYVHSSNCRPPECRQIDFV